MAFDGWHNLNGQEYYLQTAQTVFGRTAIFPKQLAHSDCGGFRYNYDANGGYWAPTKDQCEMMLKFFKLIK